MALVVVVLILVILYLLLRMFLFRVLAVVLAMWMKEHDLSIPTEKDMKRLSNDAVEKMFKHGR